MLELEIRKLAVYFVRYSSDIYFPSVISRFKKRKSSNCMNNLRILKFLLFVMKKMNHYQVYNYGISIYWDE